MCYALAASSSSPSSARTPRPSARRSSGSPARAIVHTGFFERGRLVLVDAAGLDAALATLGLAPVTPTRTVRVATDLGHRTSVVALYTRPSAG